MGFIVLSSRKQSFPEVLALLETLSKRLLPSLEGLNGNDRDLLAIWRGCPCLGLNRWLFSGDDTTIFALWCAFKSNDAGLMEVPTVPAGVLVMEKGADRQSSGEVTGLAKGQAEVGDSRVDCRRQTMQNILFGFSAVQNPTSNK